MTIYAYEKGKFALSTHYVRSDYMYEGEQLIKAGFEVYGSTK